MSQKMPGTMKTLTIAVFRILFFPVYVMLVLMDILLVPLWLFLRSDLWFNYVRNIPRNHLGR